MRNKITAALLVLLAVTLGAPLVNGLLMERVIRNSYDEANALYAEAGSDAVLEIVRYDRGYRSSEIEWKLKLGQLRTIYGVDEIIFIDRARHHLLGIVSDTSLEKNEWFNELIAQNMEGGNPLQITTRYRLTGEIESTLAIAPIGVLVEQDRLQIGPGRLTITSDNSFTTIRTEGTLQGISFGETFALEGLSLVSNLEKISTYIWEGAISLAIDRGRAVDQDGLLEFRAIKGTYTLDYDGKRGQLSIGAELTADGLNYEDTRVERPRLRIEVGNLDAEGYERYLETSGDVANSVLSDIGRSDIGSAGPGHEAGRDTLTNTMTMAGIQLLAAGENLLKKDLEIRISDLFVRMPSGDITGNLVFRLREDLNFMQLAPLINQPSLAFQLFSLQSSLSMPAGLVDDPTTLTAPLNPAMTTGFFRQDGDRLIHQAETRGDKLFWLLVI